MSDAIRWRPGISGVLLAAVLLRCGMLLAWFATGADVGAFEHPDTHTYLGPAQSLLDRGELLRGGEPEIVRGPGYPLLLAIGLSLGHVAAVTIALQIALSAASVYLVYRLALSVTDNFNTAIFAAALYAVEPLSVIYCGFLLSETLFTFLLLSFALCLVRFANTGGLPPLFGAALLLAASAFVRPVSYFLPVVVAGAVAIVVSKLRWPRRIAYASLFFAICAAPLAAWQIRNAQTAGYAGFSAITDQNLYFYQAAAVLAAREGKSLEAKQAEMGALDDAVLFEQHPEWRRLTTAERYRQMGAMAREIIRSDAAVYARIHLTAIAKLLVTPGAGDLQKLTNDFGSVNASAENAADDSRSAGSSMQRRIAQLVLGGFLVILLALAAGGWVFAAGPVAGRRLLLAVAGYLLVVSGVPEPPARLRHPIMPIVCVFAGAGVAALVQKMKVNRRGSGQFFNIDPNHSQDSLQLRRAG